MSITVPCPECNASLELPDEVPAGKQLQCPDCGAAFRPPAAADRATGLKAASSRPPASAAPRRRPRPEDDDFEDRESPRPKRGGTGVLFVCIALAVLLGLGLIGLFLASLVEVRSQPPVAMKAAPPPVVMGGPAVPVAGGAAMAPVAPPVMLKAGDAAPEIDGEDLDGKPMKLSDFRGNVVVLDFWGDWCPHCKPAYTYQNHLLNRLKGEPFVVLGVNNDVTKEQARLVVNVQKVAWRSWYDGNGQAQNGPIAQRYGVMSVPTVFVIDKKGVIRQRFDGRPLELVLDNAVDQALAADEKRPANAPPRWEPGSTAFSQLGDEVAAGRYRLRLPAGFVAAGGPPEAGRETYRWRGPQRPDGVTPVLEVVLSPAREADKKLEAVLEKDVAAVPHPTLGWSCSAAERGDVKGLTFARVRWSVQEAPMKWNAFGYLYAAVDGDTLIRISYRDSAGTFGTPQDAVPLTLRKAPAP